MRSSATHNMPLSASSTGRVETREDNATVMSVGILPTGTSSIIWYERQTGVVKSRREIGFAAEPAEEVIL